MRTRSPLASNEFRERTRSDTIELKIAFVSFIVSAFSPCPAVDAELLLQPVREGIVFSEELLLTMLNI